MTAPYPHNINSYVENMSSDQLMALAKSLSDHCRKYRDASLWRSLTQLALTLGLFLAGLVAMYWSLEVSYWLTLALALPTGGLLVRLFIIQHDCGHGSYFRSAKANKWVGRLMSLFTVTPYDFWKRAHTIHHATCGNLDKRGVGDITTLTLNEYKALSPIRRIGYRLYRNPLFLFFIGVPLYFAVLQRLPFAQPLPSKDIWRSVLGLDLALVVVIGGAIYTLGAAPFLSIYLPVLIVSSVIGGWMFFIQHQYENVYWADSKEWDFNLAGLLGSSYYVLPKAFQWLTGNIGLHHIHHLNSRIPNYRLQECLDARPELLAIPKKLRFIESLRCVRLALWDEDNHQLVGFAAAR